VPVVSAVLIGQAPSRECPRPFRCAAGRRLAAYAGTDLDHLLSVFSARNLLDRHPGRQPGGKWDAFPVREARERGTHLRRYVLPRRDVALVCGVATARALGLQTPLSITRVGRCDVYVVPHPAGTSMWWNDPGRRRAGATLARAALRAAEESER
jgi:hypothetical protein